MEDLTELRQIWASMPTNPLPDYRTISREIRKYRIRNLLKTSGVLLFIIGIAFLMGRVIVVYNSKLLSTRLGEGLMVTAIVIMLSYTIRSLRRLATATDQSNEGFLRFLKNEQLILFRFEKRTQVIGYIAASLGLLFYLYEGVRESITYMLIGYSLTLAWIAIAWLVLRPIVMKRKKQRINERIKDLERILHQLND